MDQIELEPWLFVRLTLVHPFVINNVRQDSVLPYYLLLT